MGKLKFGSGGIRIEMDDVLDRMYRNALERVAPGVVDQIERATNEVFTEAVAEWPVRTGTSRAGLEQHVTVTAEGDAVRGTITNAVAYSKFIRAKSLDGRSPLVELLRKPLRQRAGELSDDLAKMASAELKG
ncbi:MAG: hypothetical protein ABMA64_07090 [Myxococcota bacterium]